MNLKKFIQKDRHGNMMHFEFETEANVPSMQQIPMPMYDHPGDPKGTDTVPAWLTPGEFVVNKEATDIYGPVIKQMNDHGREIQEDMPQYAERGMKVIPGLPMKKPNLYKLFQQENRMPTNFKQESVDFTNINKFDDTINKAADRYNLNPNFLKAVLYAESSGNPTAEGDKNLKNKAFGLGQIRKPAFDDIIEKYGRFPFKKFEDVQNNPIANIEASAQYLQLLKDNYVANANKGAKGFQKDFIESPDNEMNVMYQFYNAGPYTKSPTAVTNANKVMMIKSMLEGTSFPGEEKYQEPVKPKEEKSWYDKLLNIKMNEGGNVPVYYAHGGPHVLDPSTWNLQHWEGKGNLNRGDDPFLPQSDDEFAIPTIVVPGFEGQNPNNMSPLRLKAYNKALAEMQNNNVPIETEVTKNRNDVDYGNPNLEIPELDGIAVPPGELPKGVADYTGEDRSLTEIAFPKTYESRPQFSGQMTNQIGKPNKVQQAEQAFANDEETKDTFFNDIIISSTGEPQSVNSNRISEDRKNQIEELYATSGNRERYDAQINEFNMAVMQDKAHKAWKAKQDRITSEQQSADDQKEITKLESQKIDGNDSVNEKIEKKINEIKNKNKPEEKTITLSEKNDKKLMDLWTSTSKSKTIVEEKPNITKEKIISTGKEGNNKDKQNAEFTLKGFFGDLFDTKELKRAAIIYLGSRLLGGSHNGSLKYVAKSYLDRVDTKSAAKTKWIRENATKYTPESLKAYEESGDWSVLVPKGQIPRGTGERKFFYDSIGKKRQALKYNITTPDGKNISYYSYDGGKTRVPQGHHDDAKLVPTSDEYQKEVNAQASIVSKIIAQNRTTYDETITKTDKLGSKKKTYVTKILPEGDAQNVALWAKKNGYNMQQLGGQIQSAYELAIQDSTARNIQATTLIPYLEQLEMRNIAGVMGITEEKIGDTVYKLNNDKFKTMNQDVLNMILPGNNNAKQQKEALQGFYGKLNQSFLQDPDRAKYVANTPDGYTPFGYYLQQAIEANKLRLAQSK